MASTRRLAAILAADVAGYSRLMGADEEGTHERLKTHRRELVDPKIGEHSGRIVKTTGDGMLAEFASVVDAVRCAVEIQRAMIDREAGMPEDRRIRFRIGVNLGDIIVENDDIFGDGVNVGGRGWKPCRIPAASASHGWCGTRSATSWPTLSWILARRSSEHRPAGALYGIRTDAVALLPHVATTAQPISGPRGIAARIAGLIGGGIAGWADRKPIEFPAGRKHDRR
jgi:hypothetical protein